MNKYRIKIGSLYIYDIGTNNESPETMFINAIELRNNMAERYTLSQAQSIVKILSEIGITSEIECIKESGEDNEN